MGEGFESADHSLPSDTAIAEANSGLTWVKRGCRPPTMYVIGGIVFGLVPLLCNSLVTCKPLNF